MERKTLEAKKREITGKRTRFLREKGILPAIVYGKGMEPVALEIDEKNFAKIMHAGRNIIIDLKIAGQQALPVLAHAIQIHPFNDNILNIDFIQIRMDEKITARVKVVLKGVSLGVKADGGILVNPINEIEVKCLPDKIPEKIEIDLSPLMINDAVHVSDLPAIEGVEFLTPGQDIVVTIAPPAKEEEVAAPAVAAVPLEGEAAAAVPEGGAPVAAAADASKAAVKPGAKPEAEKVAKETKK